MGGQLASRVNTICLHIIGWLLLVSGCGDIKDQPRAPSSDAGTLDYSMADTALDVSYTPSDSTIDLTGLDAVTAEDMTALIDGPI